MRKSFNIGRRHSVTVEGVLNGFGLIGIGLSFDPGDSQVIFNIHLWTFGLYISFEGDRIRNLYKRLKLKHPPFGYNLGISLAKDLTLRIDCLQLTKDDEDKSLVYFNLMDLLGKSKYWEVEHEQGALVIEMQEGEYKAEYRSFTSYWKRAAWFTSRLRRISIKMLDSVPIPIEQYDLEDGSTHGVTMPFPEDQDLVDAKIAFINSINHHRVKHGGKDWKPKPAKSFDIGENGGIVETLQKKPEPCTNSKK